ncbi:hypothetical protein [Streptomyces sp. NPDC056480]|uniref:hypothetical protein n=1 Tax=Streptomyces sp. NPDC056480 TaxID=3345833 RepID=UPI0036C4937A
MTALLAVKSIGVELGITADVAFESDPIYTEATLFPLGTTDMRVQINEAEASDPSLRPLGMRYGVSMVGGGSHPWRPGEFRPPGRDGEGEYTLHETMNLQTIFNQDNDVEQDYFD